MLEEAGADFNHVTESGDSVLSYALWRYSLTPNNGLDHMETVVDYLLERTNIGEHIFFSFKKNKNTKPSLDPNLRDRYGATPLHMAAHWGTVSI